MLNKYRQLVRVIQVEKDGAWFYFPELATTTALFIEYELLPKEIINLIEVGKRFHVKCNSINESLDELLWEENTFSDWEIE